LDFFEQTTNTSELVKEHVTKELLILTHYQVNSKEISCPFQWLKRHEVAFFIVDFFQLPNLGTLRSQIENEKMFFNTYLQT
jgi:hypothetical protein